MDVKGAVDVVVDACGKVIEMEQKLKILILILLLKYNIIMKEWFKLKKIQNIPQSIP